MSTSGQFENMICEAIETLVNRAVEKGIDPKAKKKTKQSKFSAKYSDRIKSIEGDFDT